MAAKAVNARKRVDRVDRVRVERWDGDKGQGQVWQNIPLPSVPGIEDDVSRPARAEIGEPSFTR